MLVGENSRTVAKAVAAKLKGIQVSLPPGITVTAVYDRTRLVDKTLDTVRKNLLEGALLVPPDGSARPRRWQPGECETLLHPGPWPGP